MKDPGRVLILGAGPTGLGAAYRFREAGFDNFLVLEAADRPGGLSASYQDERGFTWDVGGHVQFSHYGYYDAVLDRVLGSGWLHHQRESWIYIKNRYVPYPFQYNLHRLDPPDCRRAWQGLLQTRTRDRRPRPANFREWIEVTFGRGIGELFLYPYNFKVWAYPVETLGVGWMGDRVALPDLDRIRLNLELDRDDPSWGPNQAFRYPLQGGTGAIWEAVAAVVGPERIRYATPVEAVDLEAKRVKVRGGLSLRFDTLITSLPLDAFCLRCQGLDQGVRKKAASLIYSSCHAIGLGFRGGWPQELEGKSWIYFPEEHSPYYRVTVLSHYSPHNVPPGPGYWSLLAEVSESPFKPVDRSRVVGQTIQALKRDGLVTARARLVSCWHRREEHAYPTPFLGRNQVLAPIQQALETRRVFSRGRFGAWKYEVSNQDHCFMQGVEVADRLLGKGEEVTLKNPQNLNAKAFKREY